MHNARPALLSNEAAQCKTVVRSAWRNGLARVSEAISAWHHVFGIVRFLFDGFLFKYDTVGFYIFFTCFYMFFTCFYMFSTEELRLATGTSAPVARKKNCLYMFL